MNRNELWQQNLWDNTSHWNHALSSDKFDHYSSIPYSNDVDDEMRILKLTVPKEKRNLPTIVWFHGGGFTNDNRECPQELFESRRFAIAEPRYRLSPKNKAPDYHEDGAMALAWVLNNIDSLGGDSKRVIVGGMSAGAYLAMIVTMDKRWLAPYGFSYHDFIGILSLSGQVSTHFLVQTDLNLPEDSPFSPLQYLSADLPPILLVTGDVACDIPGRPEENIKMASLLHNLGHKSIECHSLGGKNHSDTFLTGGKLIIPFIDKFIKP